MRLALVSDLHGNLPALEAVLAELDEAGIDALVCLGDIAAGPDPATQDCTNPSSWTSETHVAGPFDMETAPNAGGLFVGDYEGLARAGNSFVAFFAMANDGNLANRTDIFKATLNP